MEEQVIKEFQSIAGYYAKKHPSILAIIAYGSKLFAEATADSHYDFWFIIKDYNSFYRKNLREHRTLVATLLFPFSEKDVHIFLNKLNPNFYQQQLGGKHIKYGVINIDDFVELCKPETFRMYVKGRFQKPVEIVYCSNQQIKDRINLAIDDARKDGVEKALALSPKYSSLDELIQTIIRLSYLADIRPENPNKVRDIFEKSKDELREIYFNLLNNVPPTENSDKIKRYLFLNKIFSGLMNLKNGLTNKYALSYVLRKIRRKYEK